MTAPQFVSAQYVMMLNNGEHIVSTYEFFGMIVAATNTRYLLLGGKAPREVPLACFSLDMGRA